MLRRDECEALLVEQLEWVWSSMARLCRRYRLTPADTEEFASWATLRLVEHDYQILRQFRGDSSLRTYLVVVLTMLHHEFRVRQWGRWRPSAAARRRGPVAVEL